MTDVVYLHVGGPKSGTTFVQHVLQANAEALAQAGVLVAGPRLELIHAAMAVRGDRRLEQLPESAASAWERVATGVRAWSGHSAIVSYELFAGASAAQASAALQALAGLEVHVVVSARDLGKSIPSAWQEQLKFGLTKPLEKWRPPAETVADSEWGWRTMQPANVAARWGADLPPERVHVVTVPGDSADSSELWHRFAEACGLSHLTGLDLSMERVNESLGVVEAELLRRVNKALDGRVQGSRQRSLWIRDVLAHQVLAPIGREPIGLTDAQLGEAQDEANRAAAAILAAGYRVHGDLADLRPGSGQGRLPGQVSDREVLESATLALADLLVWAGQSGADPHGSTPGSTPGAASGSTPQEGAGGRLALARSAVRTTLHRVATPAQSRQVAELEARVAELEAQVAAERALHLRVASLTDLVQELLLPAAQQDKRVTSSALRSYRKGSL